MLKTIIKGLLGLDKKRFQRICRVNNIHLDYEVNKRGLAILDAIFVQREYADYFPFGKSATIVDIGAHYGYFSLFAHQHAGCNAKIYSVEPSSSNFERLQKNIRANGFSEERCFQFAVTSEEVETIPLSINKDENHSIATIANASKHLEEVPAINLERFLEVQKIDTIHFLKLDCEGAEYTILEHASPETLARIQVISMEFHDVQSETYNGNYLRDLLEVRGFDIVRFEHSPTNKNLNHGHIIARRRKD